MPDKFPLPPAQELKLLVDQLTTYQVALGWDDKRFCATHGRYVGSPDTWARRMKAGLFQEVKAERWIPKLRELVARFETGTAPREFYPRLPFFVWLQTAVEQLEGQDTDRRCLFALGDTGVGKSVAAKRLVEEDRDRRAYVEIPLTCRECERELLACIAESVKVEVSPAMPATPIFRAVANSLRANPRTIFIDEAHKGGVRLMSILHQIINQTGARFVYLALATEFFEVRSASSKSRIEARQLLGRSMKPIEERWIAGVRDNDVAAFLRCSLNGERNWKQTAREIRPHLSGGYNLRTLADAVVEARAEADERGTDVDEALLKQSVETLVGLSKETKEEA